MLIGDLSNVKSSAGSTCSPGFAGDTIRELADAKNDKALNPTVQLQRLEQQVHVLNEGGLQRFGIRCRAKQVDRRQLVKGLANIVDERKPRGRKLFCHNVLRNFTCRGCSRTLPRERHKQPASSKLM